MQDSHVVIHEGGGFTMVGKDAVAMYRVTALARAILLYAKTGMIPTRGMTITKMLVAATGVTNKKYKRGQFQEAYNDLMTWQRTMKAALPYEDSKGNPL